MGYGLVSFFSPFPLPSFPPSFPSFSLLLQKIHVTWYCRRIVSMNITPSLLSFCYQSPVCVFTRSSSLGFSYLTYPMGRMVLLHHFAFSCSKGQGPDLVCFWSFVWFHMQVLWLVGFSLSWFKRWGTVAGSVYN